MSSARLIADVDSDPHTPPIANRLKLYFALLSCLGGLVLASGSETESIPVIAVFFSIFGFLFVDYWKLFALPPIAAYAAMAVAAVYCVSDFADLNAPGNHQMVAVAQLLVFVQAILMLQRKSRRIFEQLGVFCLLELIVAAVFNNAINYGLLLVPIGIIGAWALSLLSAVSATEGLHVLEDLEADDEALGFLRSNRNSSSISVRAPESVHSLTSAAMRLPRISLVTLAPAVMLVAAIFFYGLPRTTDAAKVRNRGTALVGFDDEMHLEQIGMMQQSTAPALRVYLSDRRTNEVYDAESMYLRGRVLERYSSRLSATKNTASWMSVQASLLTLSPTMPNEFFPSRSTDTNFYDPLMVSIVCESMRNNSLFTIAPYHQIKNEPNIVHSVEEWTLARESDSGWVYPRISYMFGTNAFRAGIQSDLIVRPVYRPRPGIENASREIIRAERDRQARAELRSIRYEETLLEFDIDAMPTAARMAERFVIGPGGERRSDYEIARALTSYLATSVDFAYTLNLDSESLPGVDPIEQFLSTDRKGHCQYFASALVMMLRSQDIPARIVVGYHTDEFNELGQYYVARQLHAHSWVEALIDRDQLKFNRNVYGQPEADQYWLRLDPTPVAGRIRESGGGVGQYLDVAQNVWDDYVVDMDAARQETALLGGGMNPMSRSYANLVDWLSLTIGRLRAGELGGGSLASQNLFSWPAAVFGVIMTIFVVLVFRFRPPAWIGRTLRRNRADAVARPQIDFYAETLDQLARVGIQRKSAQTPDELRVEADAKWSHPMIPSISGPLARLTSIFYRARFGTATSIELAAAADSKRDQNAEVDSALAELIQSVDMVVSGSNGSKRKRSEQTE